jgi:hypothetical protein
VLSYPADSLDVPTPLIGTASVDAVLVVPPATSPQLGVHLVAGPRFFAVVGARFSGQVTIHECAVAAYVLYMGRR